MVLLDFATERPCSSPFLSPNVTLLPKWGGCPPQLGVRHLRASRGQTLGSSGPLPWCQDSERDLYNGKILCFPQFQLVSGRQRAHGQKPLPERSLLGALLAWTCKMFPRWLTTSTPLARQSGFLPPFFRRRTKPSQSEHTT